MFPKVVQVIPNNDYTVYVYFEDGKIVLYDASSLVKKGVFTVLQDINTFITTCTVLNDTLAWDLKGNRDTTDCLDIDPDTLYELPNTEERIA